MEKLKKLRLITKVNIRKNLRQIFALAEKNVKLSLRFKINFIVGLFTPLVTISMPLIIMNRFFPTVNLFVYQFIAYKVFLIKSIITDFPIQMRMEKYWKTLPALLIGPFNRLNLLFGIFVSRIILISIPFSLLFILTFIVSPINIITVLFIVILYFFITLIFSGIGLLFSAFTISKENLLRPSVFAFNILFLLSCITYPYDVFPSFIQAFINLNPFYYIFDMLRLSWLEDNVLLTLTSHFYEFAILFSFAIIIPLLGVYFFNLVYNKYGIVGY